MSGLWSMFVEALQAGIFGLTHFYGGQLGPAIVTFSLLARLGLLPLTLRISRRSRSQRRALRALQPELLRLREQWGEDPTQLVKETMAVYEREGVRPLDPAILKGSVIQAPLFLGLFQCIRGVLASAPANQAFLWMGSLASPDRLLALLVVGLVGAGTLANGPVDGESQRTLLLVSSLATLFMLLRFSAGFGLYMGASATVTTLQGLLIRRRERA